MYEIFLSFVGAKARKIKNFNVLPQCRRNLYIELTSIDLLSDKNVLKKLNITLLTTRQFRLNSFISLGSI